MGISPQKKVLQNYFLLTVTEQYVHWILHSDYR